VAITPYRYVVVSTEAYTLKNGLPKAAADPTRPPISTRGESGNSGYWKVYAYNTSSGSRVKVDISTVRGAPTQVSSVTTTDPFGPATASLTFPAVTILDSVGTGDLDWMVPEYDVDIVWVNADPTWGTVGAARYTWEGYFTSYEYESGGDGSGLTVTCRGALFQMDNYLAKPEYPYRPLPYEVAIRQAFLDPAVNHTQLRPDTRLADPTTVASAFPSGWTKTFLSANYDATNAPWSVPEGVADNDKWTGLLTRQTGNFEPMLSGYIQGLLSNMQFSVADSSTTPTGQFTLLLDSGRVPSLKFRPFLTSASQTPLAGESVLTVDLTWPGVTMQATQDYSQRASVVYTQGTAKNGEVYSGMEVSSDGDITTYKPSAYLAAVHPPYVYNTYLNKNVMRKEIKVDFGEGLTPRQAQSAAAAYIRRFVDPGVSGSITLTTDPLTQAGRPFPRWIIQAGSTLLVKGLFGGDVLMHVTAASVSEDGTVSLTVDSKYRDQLTVDQVRLRGRDSLKPMRSISTNGTYAPKVEDLLYPWSYATGAGVIPEWRSREINNGLFFQNPITYASSSKSIFERATKELTDHPGTWGFTGSPSQVSFPWTAYTNIFPPSSYPRFYAKVQAKQTNANYNWAQENWVDGDTFAQNYARWAGGPGQTYRVKLAAKGNIRLIQIAAYNADGTVKQVPFHVSIYNASGMTPAAMPMIPAGAKFPNGVSYATGQHYPFFAEAWERINPNGTTPTNTQQLVAADGGTFLAGWGTYYERGGYWPGSSANGDAATGLLQDEIGFSWDFTTAAGRVDPQKSFSQQQSADVWAYVMIYCESTTPTYFLGRLWQKTYE